jgi:hypothetical protein
MKRKLLPATVCLVVMLPISSADCLYRYRSTACKQRGSVYSAKVEKLKRDAQEKLRVGTKKDAVIRFFDENGIPVTFSRHEASGTIYTTGCAPSGCGSDAALLGLRVEVDETGTVLSEPVAGTLYTNSL